MGDAPGVPAPGMYGIERARTQTLNHGGTLKSTRVPRNGPGPTALLNHRGGRYANAPKKFYLAPTSLLKENMARGYQFPLAAGKVPHTKELSGLDACSMIRDAGCDSVRREAVASGDTHGHIQGRGRWFLQKIRAPT
jgi:hypothetical protein